MGRDYWASFEALLNRMAEEKTIDPSDLNLLLITDDPAEALAHIQKHAVERFHLRQRPEPRRWALLRE
jgi:predicted Rossmann-fold nucleotide-binding protein